MKDTTHEDAEMLARIASVVGRLGQGFRLHILGYAKGLALRGTAGPTCHDAITAGTIDEVFGICNAYSIDGYPAASLLLDLFNEQETMTHADIHAFKLSRSWEEPTTGAEGVTVR